MTKNTARIVRCGFLGAALIVAPSCILGQAAPGPLAPPQPPPGTQAAPQPAPKPKPQIAPRSSLSGNWKLDADQSDDARHKVRLADDSGGGFPHPSVGTGYPGYPAGGYPYPGGYPGGPGGGYPGSPYPDPYPDGGGAPQISGKDLAQNPKLQAFIYPPRTLSVAMKQSAGIGAQNAVVSEVDMTDPDFNVMSFFTDGRELPKATDDSHEEAAAHWDGSQLISNEKSPLGGKMSRTFELSKDGRQMIETVHIDHGKKKPIDIRYVYDAINTDIEPGDSDPNRPVLKRNQDGSANNESSQLQ
ncbi:MAG: hypothetical protein ACRD40_02805 [Candidatus Acidiferrales bacterium]